MNKRFSSIRQRFLELRSKGKKAFIPYIMAGYPSGKDTLRLFRVLEETGADIIELGVPFTDPLADGPVIQKASEEALRTGMNLSKTLELLREIRKNSTTPVVLMTYYNPVFKYGEERFVKDALMSGADGVIIPDLPPEESGPLRRFARSGGLDTIFLVAPTSTPQRLKLIAKNSTGFIYYVSITGITGSRLNLDGSQHGIIEFLRSITNKPIAIGFGISTPQEARLVAGFSDGVIVGSAIIKRLESGESELRKYLLELSSAIHETKSDSHGYGVSSGRRKY